MSNRPDDAIEAAVIDRLAGLLGGTARRIDDGTADRLHDYEFDLPDGRTVAVEITGEVDDAARATNAATRKHRLDHTDAGLDIDVVWCWRRGADWSYHGRSPTVLSDDA